MRIRKYDFDYSKRVFMEKTMLGVATAGVLAPLWPLIARGADTNKAYPDELLSIEAYTKGKIKNGDVVTAANVEHVKELLDPIAYEQVKNMGRRITIVPQTTDVSTLYPQAYLEATLRNKGRAHQDKDGNVWTDNGEPWVGGNPFPEAKTGLEAIANLTLSWGRHDYVASAVRDWDIKPDGSQAYQYDFMWTEFNTTGRLGQDGPIWRNRKDLARFNATWFTAPQDTNGTSYLNTWYYDQRKFPDLLGYLPAFRRVRQFPTNQRFEPLAPGLTLFLSDAWASGDPMLTWGNYKIVGRKPHLGAISNNWFGGRHPNWEKPAHGGPKNQTFFDTFMELVPEVIVLESEPVGYPRAPVSKRRTWIDVRNMGFVASITYDRRGEIWKSFEPGYCQYRDGNTVFKEADGSTVWSWTHVMCHDIQSNRMSRWQPVKGIKGGYKTEFDEGGKDVYNAYFTPQAIQRLGAA
jgi:hypothetical protein